MKPINKTYYNLNSETEASYCEWDMANADDEIVIPALVTTGVMNGSKSQLDSAIYRVIDKYEESL